MMMMGYAYQKGLLPLSAEAIEQAIEVNGVSIKMNKEAFRLGRLAVADPARLAEMLKGTDEVVAPKTLDAMFPRACNTSYIGLPVARSSKHQCPPN